MASRKRPSYIDKDFHTSLERAGENFETKTFSTETHIRRKRNNPARAIKHLHERKHTWQKIPQKSLGKEGYIQHSWLKIATIFNEARICLDLKSISNPWHKRLTNYYIKCGSMWYEFEDLVKKKITANTSLIIVFSKKYYKYFTLYLIEW